MHPKRERNVGSLMEVFTRRTAGQIGSGGSRTRRWLLLWEPATLRWRTASRDNPSSLPASKFRGPK